MPIAINQCAGGAALLHADPVGNARDSTKHAPATIKTCDPLPAILRAILSTPSFGLEADFAFRLHYYDRAPKRCLSYARARATSGTDTNSWASPSGDIAASSSRTQARYSSAMAGGRVEVAPENRTAL
jgi:hypothetical protein